MGRPKRTEQMYSAVIIIRVAPPLKADVDRMSEATDIPTSQRVRAFLQREVEKWKEEGGT
jgi:hypothetical protein